MPQIVSAVVTDAWRTKLAQMFKGDVSFALPASFAIGEGGWTNPGSGKEPVTPSSSVTAMDASGGEYVFAKNITAGDLTYTAPSRLEIRCYVATNEANSNNSSNAPEFFELAVFDGPVVLGSPSGTMIAYSTFPIEIKTSSKALEHIIYVDF